MTLNWGTTHLIKFSFLLFMPVLLWSCEEKIEVNLNNDTPKVVIESYITNSENPIVVKITKSQGFFNQSSFTPVLKASVQLESLPVKETLFGEGGGYYVSSRMQVIAGRSYNLKIVTGGASFGATVSLRNNVPIDTIYFKPGFFRNDSLNVFVEFRDPPKSENFYRIKVYYNGRYAVNEYFLLTDVFSNGEKIIAPIYSHNFAPGDTVAVELLNLERNTWRYFKGLSESIQQGVNSQAPGNPPTNFTGGALGIFGAWNSSVRRVIIPKTGAGK